MVFWVADYESAIIFPKSIRLNILFTKIIAKNANFQKMFAKS